MIYDSEGLLRAERGKRRPNMPKSVTCDKCGKEALKVRYGTYECTHCMLVYQFRYGELVKGEITWEYSMPSKEYTRGYNFYI